MRGNDNSNRDSNSIYSLGDVMKRTVEYVMSVAISNLFVWAGFTTYQFVFHIAGGEEWIELPLLLTCWLTFAPPAMFFFALSVYIVFGEHNKK